MPPPSVLISVYMYMYVCVVFLLCRIVIIVGFFTIFNSLLVASIFAVIVVSLSLLLCDLRNRILCDPGLPCPQQGSGLRIRKYHDDFNSMLMNNVLLHCR